MRATAGMTSAVLWMARSRMRGETREEEGRLTEQGGGLRKQLARMIRRRANEREGRRGRMRRGEAKEVEEGEVQEIDEGE